jgi:hypothetical protein
LGLFRAGPGVTIGWDKDQYVISAESAIARKAGASSAISQFKISDDMGDYWSCYTWDGTTLGSTFVKVAKPYKLRCSTGAIQIEVVRGSTLYYQYSYASGIYTRSVFGNVNMTTQSLLERDVINPSPLVNDIIYAASGFSTLSPSTLTDVTYLDLNVDGRAWAEI